MHGALTLYGQHARMPESGAAALEAQQIQNTTLGRTQSSRVSLLLVGGSGLLFAAQSACLKVSLAQGVGALEFVAVRGTIQLLGVLVCLLTLRPLPVKHWLGVSATQRRWLLLRGFVGFLGIALSMAALERLPMGDASALNFISPIVSTLVAALTMGPNERIDCTDAALVSSSSTGILLIARPSFLFGHSTQPLDALGVVLALSAAVTAGCAVVLIRKLAKGGLHFTVVLLYQAVGQMIFSQIAMPLFSRAWVWPSPIATAALLLGGICGFLAQVMLTKGLSRETVGKASVARSTGVLGSFALQLAVTPDEPIQPLSVLGASLITASCAVMLVRASHRQTLPAQTSSTQQLELVSADGAAEHRDYGQIDSSALDQFGGRCVVLYTSLPGAQPIFARESKRMLDVLDTANIDFLAVDGADPERKWVREALWKAGGTKVYPLLFLDNKLLGGYAQLEKLVECNKDDGCFDETFAQWMRRDCSPAKGY
jgi:drug/metabolite transporter (DMT)-like permease